MIGYLTGEILFSDGTEVILKPVNQGVGYQVHSFKVYPEGSIQSVYISHIVRENSEELYSFDRMKDKKLFEMLITVSGVGPKSAYALIGSVGPEDVIRAVSFEDEKTLTKAPGIGKKAASKIILDLSNKIEKVSMYGHQSNIIPTHAPVNADQPALFEPVDDLGPSGADQMKILNEALAACSELGFKEDKIKPMAKKLMNEIHIQKPEQLVHLVLKEM